MKTVVLLSGGLDSAVVLARAVENRNHVTAVSFYYGSKHGTLEGMSSIALCDHYKIGRKLFNVEDIFRGFGSALLGREKVPEGHYNEETMRQTVVPGRNMIFISIAAAWAEANGYDMVHIGAHAGDHHIYPDCRANFIDAMQGAVMLGSGRKVILRAPLITMSKYDIVRVGLALGVPFHLTRTCYTGNAVACGRCGSCQERLEAFAQNGEPDPIEYESRELLTKS